jgi:hypothetical protein
MHVMSRAWRLSTAVGAAVGLSVLALGPAHADTPTVGLQGGWLSAALAPGSAGKVVGYYLQAEATADTTISGVTVTYDVSGLAGVATLTPQSGKCATAGTLITCTEAAFSTSRYTGSEESSTPYIGTEVLPIKLVPVAGAAAGASGSVAVTVSAPSPVVTNSGNISVSLTDGPDLVLKKSTAELYGTHTVSVSAGAAYYRSVEFTNDGDQAAQGITLEVQTDGYGADIPELRKNCEYEAPTLAYCYIPDIVAPGATEKLSPALEVLTTTDLMWQNLRITVVPGYASLSPYTIGTGKPFTLLDSTGAGQVTATGQTTQNNVSADNELVLELQVPTATADLAASLSMFPWMVNGQYIVNADAVNDGSGYIWLGRSANWTFSGDITIPSGVTFVSVPAGWIPVVNGSLDWAALGQPGYSEYRFNGGIDLAAGGQAGLGSGSPSPIIEPQPGFSGGDATLTVGIGDVSAANFASLFGNIDTNTADDTATFAIPAYGS